jgi:hypothetical protein
MGAYNRKDLKAYVRYDGSGRVVPGSLILRRQKPKVGKWVEIPAYECCNPTTTTTSTTSSTTTTTTTTASPTTTTTTTVAQDFYVYKGASLLDPMAGELYKPSSAFANVNKINSNGGTLTTPNPGDSFTYSDGTNGWINILIIAVTDNGSFYTIQLNTPFVGTLTVDSTYELIIN